MVLKCCDEKDYEMWKKNLKLHRSYVPQSSAVRPYLNMPCKLDKVFTINQFIKNFPSHSFSFFFFFLLYFIKLIKYLQKVLIVDIGSCSIRAGRLKTDRKFFSHSSFKNKILINLSFHFCLYHYFIL